MPKLTVASWNLHAWHSGWSYLERLRDDHGVQVVLLQEAKQPRAPNDWPAMTPDPEDWSRWRLPIPLGLKRHFASAIVLLDDTLTLVPEVPIPLGEADSATFATSHPGQFAAARVVFPGTDVGLLVVSIYGIWLERSGNGGEASLHRAISDLTPFFLDTKAPRIVVAGDLNLFRDTNNVGQHRFDTVFTRSEAYGLHVRGPFRSPGQPRLLDCTCRQGDACMHVETFRVLRAASFPYQDDFVFATDAVEVTSCVTVVDPVIRADRLSDHWPVVAALEIS